jgi:hypothetical protein
MRKKSLIIGKNSFIVKSIYYNLSDNFDFCSHLDISIINYEEYEYVFVFSWPSTNHLFFFSILLKIPISKIVFISTTAVLSNNLKKQWNTYPVYKKYFENYVLEKDGKVLRIGILDNNKNNHAFIFPYTSFKSIILCLNNFNNFNNSNIINLFEIKNANSKRLIRNITFYFHKLSYKFKDYYLIQLLIYIISKLLFIKDRSYTADSNYFFRDVIVINKIHNQYEYFDNCLFKNKFNVVSFIKKNNIWELNCTDNTKYYKVYYTNKLLIN